VHGCNSLTSTGRQIICPLVKLRAGRSMQWPPEIMLLAPFRRLSATSLWSVRTARIVSGHDTMRGPGAKLEEYRLSANSSTTTR